MNNTNFPYPKFRWTRCFITRVASISLHPSRNFPDPRKRYTVFVGRSFWRLVMFVYATSASSWALKDSEKEEAAKALKGSGYGGDFDEEDAFMGDPLPMNALITGVRGCGKSHVMMTAAAFLTARNMTDLYRIVCVGDCRAWIQSQDPVVFFTLELMIAFQNQTKTGKHPGRDEEEQPRGTKTALADGNYMPPSVFTTFDELKGWMEAVGKRIAAHDDLRLVVFIDQLEEVYVALSSPNCPPNARIVAQIIDLLVDLRYPILIASMIPINVAVPAYLRDRDRFAEMKMPACVTYTDFDMFVELFEASKRLSDEDDSLLHDLRFWSGAVPAQITKFFTSTEMAVGDGVSAQSGANSRGLNTYEGPNCVASRLVRYRAERARAFQELVLSAASKLDRLPRMHFLLQIFRMFLHLPTDDPNISAPPTATGLESLFVPAALQKFYHPMEGIVAYRHIPTAVTPSAHYGLADVKFLTRLAPKWQQVLEALVASTLNSKGVCEESKRRMIRFYAQLRLFQRSHDEELYVSKPADVEADASESAIRLSGITQFKDPFSVDLADRSTLRRVIFAGLSPTPCLIPSAGRTNSSASAAAPILFIPGRTDYPFYDFFLAVPAERCLYAFATVPYATALQFLVNTINTATNAPLNPVTMLEMWCRDLKDAGYPRFTAKYCHIPPYDLLQQLNCPYQFKDSEAPGND